MTSTHRRGIASIFILGFFVAAPLLLLYASGYRYNNKRGHLQGFGAITIESEPEGVQVLINGERWRQDSPTRIVDLLPNVYHLEMTKEGYTTWKGDVDIQPGENELLRTITLYPQYRIPQPFEDIPAPVELLWHDTRTGWVILKHGRGQNDVRQIVSAIFLPRKKIVSLGAYRDFSFLHAAIRPEKNDLGVLFREGNEARMAVASFPIFGELEARELRPPTGTERILWSMDGSSLWFAGDYGIAEARNDFEQMRKISLPLKSFMVDADEIMWSIETAQSGGSEETEIRKRPAADPVHFQSIMDLNGDDFAFIEGGPSLYHTLYSPTLRTLIIARNTGGDYVMARIADVRGARWYSERYLYIWNEHEILLWDTVEVIDATAGAFSVSPRTITRISSEITSSVFNPYTGAVFYTTPLGLYVIDTRAVSRQKVHELVLRKKVELLGLDEAQKEIFWHESEGVYRYPLK